MPHRSSVGGPLGEAIFGFLTTRWRAHAWLGAHLEAADACEHLKPLVVDELLLVLVLVTATTIAASVDLDEDRAELGESEPVVE